MFDQLLHPREARLAAELYALAVAAARRPALYRDLGVPDTLDGRFDMVAVQVFLLLDRLKDEASARRLSRLIAESFFSDMDRSLREMGVGDTGVPRRVKLMAQAYFGRIAAYGSAFPAGDAAVQAALLRNVYRGVAPAGDRLALLAAQLRHEARCLADMPLATIRAGTLPQADLVAATAEERP